jgi:hypothetical protein
MKYAMGLLLEAVINRAKSSRDWRGDNDGFLQSAGAGIFTPLV